MSGAMADVARRNTIFDESREPFSQNANLQLQSEKTSGPFSSLNPTRARFTLMTGTGQPKDITADDDDSKGSEGAAAVGGPEASLPSNVDFKYSKRDNRKGRHALVVRPAATKDEQTLITPAPTSSFRHVLAGTWRMFTYFPVWDISWLVAITFTVGSVVWVINGFFVFLPFATKHEFSGQTLYGGGITAFIGATIFEIGSAFLMMEAVNENRTGCFGWAVEQLYEGDDPKNGPSSRIVPARDGCSHHHQNTLNIVGQPSIKNRSTNPPKADPTPEGDHSWVWWPSKNELETHYAHDLGFIACSIQTIAATVFWISGFTALPGIYNHMSQPLIDGIYWTPQVIGASGFVISGLLFMLETQERWYIPALDTLGWHVGFWNFLGGVGFLLCPCFGYSSAHWAQYQAALTSFWGSCSFLLGSTLQWYESLEKHPVEVEKQHGS